jgi:hypothetical protein
VKNAEELSTFWPVESAMLSGQGNPLYKNQLLTEGSSMIQMASDASSLIYFRNHANMSEGYYAMSNIRNGSGGSLYLSSCEGILGRQETLQER